MRSVTTIAQVARPSLTDAPRLADRFVSGLVDGLLSLQRVPYLQDTTVCFQCFTESPDFFRRQRLCFRHADHGEDFRAFEFVRQVVRSGDDVEVNVPKAFLLGKANGILLAQSSVSCSNRTASACSSPSSMNSSRVNSCNATACRFSTMTNQPFRRVG